eukprot:TRINITY_DN185_c0_g1_i1.p1 TRINITY_DN185_c0_g1~~TRINITY_DN185_c0_g1_i1.p1  ORF type:complete len:219 (-),score=43.59 TRINITY_DN185_c0_g1_i1:120-776(-)
MANVYNIQIHGQLFKIKQDPTETVGSLIKSAEKEAHCKLLNLRLRNAALFEEDIIEDVLTPEDVLVAQYEGKIQTTSNAEAEALKLPEKTEILQMLKDKHLSLAVARLIKEGRISTEDLEKIIQENKLDLTKEDIKNMVDTHVTEISQDLFINKACVKKDSNEDASQPSKDDLIRMLEKKSGVAMTGSDVCQFRQMSEEMLMQMIAQAGKKSYQKYNV